MIVICSLQQNWEYLLIIWIPWVKDTENNCFLKIATSSHYKWNCLIMNMHNLIHCYQSTLTYHYKAEKCSTFLGE